MKALGMKHGATVAGALAVIGIGDDGLTSRERAISAGFARLYLRGRPEVSTRRSALRIGARRGHTFAQGMGVVGRDAARIAANDFVREHKVPARWRRLFTDAFVRSAIRVGR